MHRTVADFLADWHKLPRADFEETLYAYGDREAVNHLFRVTASLDSQVVGEDQILGQVHDAYFAAQSEQCTDKITSALFQRAFKAAKEIRTKSSIGRGKVSVASVAVDLAVSIFGDLRDKTVMVIGSGETGELALKSLVDQGARNVIVVNRTIENAQTLAEQYRGEAAPLKCLRDLLHRADIIVSSTAADEPVLYAENFQNALKQRGNEPIFAIDIAVPRDIDEDVNDLDNVYLYNLDDLKEVTEHNMDARRAEMDHCLEMVDTHVDRFMKWRRALFAEPTIVSMSHELHAIRQRELKKTLDALPDLTDKQRNEIEYLSNRIVNNILQRPLVQIKEEVGTDDPGRVLRLVKRLFGLEEGAS
jgi:glutamyl-tRNA reductase